jgi:flagellar protein FliO/FliZ
VDAATSGPSSPGTSMFDLFGEGTPLAVRFFIAFVVVFALIGAAAWLVRRFGANSLGGAAARGRQPRLAVIEAGAVDGRRKLVIVRRDNVEHLIMIGGPTDILIEANIVRGQAANREVAASRGTSVNETLTRAVALEDAGTSWPLAPEPGTPRPRPAAAEETLQWNMPAEPVVQMPPSAPAPRRAARQQADTLAGLAHELSHPTAHPEPSIAPQRVAPSLDLHATRAAPTLDIPAGKPLAPQGQTAPAESGDQNLAEMAQRLEAALRRPGAPATPAAPGAAPAARPSRPPITAHPAPAASSSAPAQSPAQTPAQSPALASEPRIDSLNGAQDKDKAAKPEPAATPDEGGAAFGSLEQEMANLLGRPSGKS